MAGGDAVAIEQLVGLSASRDFTNGEPVHRERVEVERVPVERTVERCRQVNEVREATVGYDVRYEYNGHQFATRLDRDPGRMLRVRVDVRPEEGREVPVPPPRPPSARGPSSLSTSAGLVLESCSAGNNPAISPLARDTASRNTSTVASAEIVSARGNAPGANRLRATVPPHAKSRPTVPASSDKTRFSVSA